MKNNNLRLKTMEEWAVKRRNLIEQEHSNRLHVQLIKLYFLSHTFITKNK